MFERNLKVRQLAQQCGIDENNLSQIANGKRVPVLVTALKIAKALEVSIEELWGYLLEENK